MKSDAVRVLIVDDHEVVRAGLARLLGREADLLIVGCVRTEVEALAALEHSVPDVVILDHHLPGCLGSEVCAQILERLPTAAVLILTSSPDEEVVRSSLVAGARGVLAKGVDVAAIVTAIRAATTGSAVLGAEVFGLVRGWAGRSDPEPFDRRALTSTEKQVLRLIALGMTNSGAGEHLRMSAHAVKLHLHTAMRKLGVSRRQEAVAAGIERGVI